MSPRSLNRPLQDRPSRRADGWRAVSLGLCRLLPLVLGSALVRAEPPAPRPRDACLTDAACRAYYEAAKAHYSHGDFAEALQQYKCAYSLHAQPWMLLNIGRIYHKLGQYPQALRHYQRFADTEPPPPESLLTKTRLYQHETEVAWLAQPTSAATKPPGVSQHGTDSAGASSDEPEHVLEARATSAPPAPPEPPPAPLQTPTQAVATVVALEPAERQSQDRRQQTGEPARQRWTRRWWFWTAIAAGTVGLGVGLSAIGWWQSRPPPPPMPQPIPSDAVGFEPLF